VVSQDEAIYMLPEVGWGLEQNWWRGCDPPAPASNRHRTWCVWVNRFLQEIREGQHRTLYVGTGNGLLPLTQSSHVQGGPQTGTRFVLYRVYALISSNIGRFSNLFHCLIRRTFVIIKIVPHLKCVVAIHC